jgi:hypothetical protein
MDMKITKKITLIFFTNPSCASLVEFLLTSIAFALISLFQTTTHHSSNSV